MIPFVPGGIEGIIRYDERYHMNTQTSLARTKTVCKILCAATVLFAVVFFFITTMIVILSSQNPSGHEQIQTIFYAVTHGIAVELIALLAIVGLLDVIRGDSPFTMRQVKRFRIAGILFIVVAFVELVFPADFIAESLLSEGGMLSFSAESSGDSPSLNMATLLFALASFCMSFIFKYGVLLQQDSDDTV